jgi:ATP phosphoribosyltransferase regulatory subunit
MTAGPAQATATTADAARWIEALNQQASILMATFARAGFEPIAPDIIQPAGVFLDLVGEDLRQRTYVFTDPDGAELCLRPDLTIPAARLYRERQGSTGGAARFCYSGVVFRYQRRGGDAARPREFRQAGIESFAAADPARAEAEIVALTVEAIRAAGLRAFTLAIGDVGIVQAVLAAIDMPERWRSELAHQFWRPDAFKRRLMRYSDPGSAAAGLPSELVAALDPADPASSRSHVARHLEAKGLSAIGTRGLDEVTRSLLERVVDARAKPLPKATAALLESYLAVEAPATEAAARIGRSMSQHGIDISPALAAYDARLKLIAAEGVDLTAARFSAGFGRNFEYYSGFVFETVSPALGPDRPIAGGGRYDRLLSALGAPRPVPAVGSAIHTERLLLAVRGGAR